MKTFAERLRYAMTEAGMNQIDLSRKTGASKASISQYLSGINTPCIDRMKALADATGVTFDFLLGYGEMPKEPAVSPKKITPRLAAKCMGKSEQFIRIGLQRGILPFGNAVPGPGKWMYYINPERFRDYVGAERFNEFFQQMVQGVDVQCQIPRIRRA